MLFNFDRREINVFLNYNARQLLSVNFTDFSVKFAEIFTNVAKKSVKCTEKICKVYRKNLMNLFVINVRNYDYKTK